MGTDDAGRLAVNQRKALRRRIGTNTLRLRKIGIEKFRTLTDCLFMRIDAANRAEFNALKRCQAMVNPNQRLRDGVYLLRLQQVKILQNAALNGIFEGNDARIRAFVNDRTEDSGIVRSQHTFVRRAQPARGEFGITTHRTETRYFFCHYTFSAMSRMRRSVSSHPRQGSVMDLPNTISCC